MNIMMKNFLKKIIFSPFLAKLLLKPMLRLHTFSYNFSGLYSSITNDGLHPKHRIMKYKEWFIDNIESSWTVLDVGCNSGLMPEVMSKKAKFVYGIEIEEKYILEAKEKRKQKNIKFICADATNYDYSDFKPIDCITLSNVLEHIEHRVEFLQKLTSQVKWNNKKRFLIRVPMIDREWIVIYKKELGIEYRLDGTHFTEYTYDSFKDELDKASISIREYHIRFGEIYAICEVN